MEVAWANLLRLGGVRPYKGAVQFNLRVLYSTKLWRGHYLICPVKHGGRGRKCTDHAVLDFRALWIAFV